MPKSRPSLPKWWKRIRPRWPSASRFLCSRGVRDRAYSLTSTGDPSMPRRRPLPQSPHSCPSPTAPQSPPSRRAPTLRRSRRLNRISNLSTRWAKWVSHSLLSECIPQLKWGRDELKLHDSFYLDNLVFGFSETFNPLTFQTLQISAY